MFNRTLAHPRSALRARRARLRPGRGQRLLLSRAEADPAAVRRLHQGHRHQGQRDLGKLRPRAAHQDRRRELARPTCCSPSTSRACRTRSTPASRSRSSRRCSRRRCRRPYHGPDGAWYGISMRARVVYASKERVKQDAITYEELADPKWKGKICIRSGQHMYNNALFAAYHRQARRGEDRGMAEGPQGEPRAEALRRRPRSRRATSRPASATSASPTPITGR